LLRPRARPDGAAFSSFYLSIAEVQYRTKKDSIDAMVCLDLSLSSARGVLAARRVSHEGTNPMAKKQSDSVYRIIDVVGVSEKSWEDAGRIAVATASSSLRDLRVAEVTKMDMKVDNGKVTAFRTRVALSFKYEA
jgi:flavin-binding protein dodecin